MKRITLVLFCFFSLLIAIPAGAQTAKRHVNLGMDIDEFMARFDLPRANTPDSRKIAAAALEAMDGKRASIQMNVEGRATTYVFDNWTLCEIDITAGNTYAHELEVLTAQLGASQVADVDMAVWDRKDGTRFTLTSRAGTGVLLITPTPLRAGS